MNLNMNTEVLKEPRGFIKIIQFFTSIIAFAAVVDWRGEVQVTFACNVNKSSTVQRIFSYPFEMDEIKVKPDEVCSGVPATGVPGVPATEFDFMAHEVHQSQFFVFVGVVSFLATIVIAGFYVLYDRMYVQDRRIIWADVAVHGLLGFFWFISCIAYTSSISDIKFYSGSKYLCGKLTTPTTTSDCQVKLEPTFAGLDIAAIVGFLNVFLWWSNVWFLFKEVRSQQEELQGEGQEQPPGGYDPYSPHLGGTQGQWGSGQSSVQKGVNEI